MNKTKQDWKHEMKQILSVIKMKKLPTSISITVIVVWFVLYETDNQKLLIVHNEENKRPTSTFQSK